MADIQFPDFNALGGLMQMDRQTQRDRLDRERADRNDQWLHEDRKDARDLQRQTALAGLDEKKRKQLHDAAEWSGHAAEAVLSAPPEQKQAVLTAMLADGEQRGYGEQLKNFPKQYSPGMDGQLHFYAMKSQEYRKGQADRPQPMGAGGSAPTPGGASTSGIDRTGQLESGGNYSAVNPTSGAAGKYQFMPETWATVAQARPDLGLPFDRRQATPQQQEAAKRALDQLNGQDLAKVGHQPTDANLYYAHRFGVKGAQTFLSAPDDAPLAAIFPPLWIQQNPDLQNKTVGQFKSFVGQNFGGGPQPTMGTPPTSMVAGGANAAQMPNVSPQQVGAGPGTPAQMPNGPQFAQAGGIIPQGGGEPGRGGAMPPPADPVLELRSWVHQQFPGAAPYADKKGQPLIDSNGLVRIKMPNGQDAFVRMPPKKEARQEGPKTLEERDRETLLKGDPSTPEYAAAYAHLGSERIMPDPNSPNGFTRIKPDMGWAQPPTFQGYGATGTAPGGKTVTIEPGKGKPIDNSARDDLTKIAGPAMELQQLVQSFDPSFGGYMLEGVGDARNFAKRNLPDALGGADEKGQAQWWQRYNAFANLERNRLFGSALTPGEQAAWKSATVNTGMKPEQITENLARQRDISQKALSRIANSLVSSGYNKDAVEQLIGVRMGDMPDPIGGVPQAKPEAAPADKARQQFDLKKKYGLD